MSSAMRRIVVLLLLAVFTEAAVVTPWWLLRPVQEDGSHRTPQEKQNFLARLTAKPEEHPVFVRGSAPQPPKASRTSKDIQSRVINGGAAARGQFPWYAYIVLGSSSFCGGSLISSTWTLTAARCVSGYASFTVTLGRTSLLESQEGSISQVSRYWIMHAAFGGVFIENDVAIIRLPTPVSSTDFISPVRLPKYSQASQSFTGLDAIVTGFGRISSYNFTTSPTLQFAHVEIITNDECVRYFPLDLLDSNICVLGEDGRSPCDGDYGGPAVILEEDGQYTAIGVMSLNSLHCPSGAPAVYSRVTSFLRWIETSSGIAVGE